MSPKKETDQMGFWEHLEVLRHCLFRILAVTLVAGIVAFCFKSLLFSVVLAPKSPDFIPYRLFERLVGPLQSFEVGLINIELAQQFIIHLKVALWMGLLLVSPYVLYVLFGFVAPALYEAERCYVVKAVSGGYVMFLLGVLLMFLYWKRLDKMYRGSFVGIFLIVCFGSRFLIEFVKNDQVAFEADMVLNMGQLLSIPFVLLGIGFLVYAYVKKQPAQAVHPVAAPKSKPETHFARPTGR